jgi:hypothetical protein
MIINLKHIRALDTDNIKLDKINYNFDQLIVNSGGPKGYIGPDGNIGPQGFQGALGFQGNQGNQGVQGAISSSFNSYWISASEDNTNFRMATLFAKHIFEASYSPIIGSGYISEEYGYANQQSGLSGLPAYQWVVNRRSDKVASNLRFTSEDVLENAFDITMDNSNSLSKLHLGFINIADSQLNLLAQNHVIKSTFGNDLFSIGTGSINIYNDTSFEKPVTFNAPLSILIDSPGLDKIVVSEDNTGSVTFKTSTELGGSVKIGTIISILPSIFSSGQNFINNQTIDGDSDLDRDNPLKIRMGAGIEDYQGWYLCNGQTWTNGSISIPVPDLNSFSYLIQSNPKSQSPTKQGNARVLNDEVQLIGGAPMYLTAIEDGESSVLYNIDLTNLVMDNPEMEPIILPRPGTSFKIKKLPQIIYLKTRDLWWSQPGTDQNISTDYSLTDYSIDEYLAG